MVVLEDEAGDAKPVPTEDKEEGKATNLLTLEIFRIIKDAQQQHGLRHGDYQRYRGYCSRRLRRLRKVLKIPQGDRRHYRRRDVTTVHLTAANAENRLLGVPLLQAERAWAHAMQLRQEANTEPRKKFHLIARLKKACSHAQTLLQLCESGACDARTQLEAGAYAAWLGGALLLELQQWRRAADSLQRAQLVLDNLSAALPEDERLVYKQKVEELKPSLRYCAYNIGDESAAGDLVAMRGQGLIENLDSLMAQAKESRSGIMHEVEWRGRRVTVRPEKVRLFLIALQDLDKSVANAQTVEAKIDILENILMDCKDAISAIKDEIKSDPKLKSASELQMSGINYLLSYLMYLRLVRTIDRNNLLVQQAEHARKNNIQIDGKKVRPHDLTRLYEIILQNFTELQQLPGFESDAVYQQEIETQMKAYRAFRCYYIAQVLTGLRRFREALAMLERCDSYVTESIASKLTDKQLLDKLQILKKDIESCKFEVHADSVLEDDEDQEEENKYMSGKPHKDKKPLVDRLDEYREDTQVLTKNPNIYKMPPPMEAIPCKPLFFDLASNFIEFPNLDDKTGAADSKKQGAGLTGLVKGFLGWGKSDK
ncbi:signal recognition particle subunit SRP68 isoform X2 [Galleria mellonella]|uniref:Signal recognition particle subunit SRP68 n=1 Tax=Galleria mellonella TaxID=7137 RepID=A0A6J1WAQ6_GALME|nr:signal recognition particle subunit SRP68 isoform X2 [Galleria mellonella]